VTVPFLVQSADTCVKRSLQDPFAKLIHKQC